VSGGFICYLNRLSYQIFSASSLFYFSKSLLRLFNLLLEYSYRPAKQEEVRLTIAEPSGNEIPIPLCRRLHKNLATDSIPASPRPNILCE
jgi:hypothetical protein